MQILVGIGSGRRWFRVDAHVSGFWILDSERSVDRDPRTWTSFSWTHRIKAMLFWRSCFKLFNSAP